MTITLTNVELMFDGSRGVYIPQNFAEMSEECLALWGFEPGDKDIEYLKMGPDAEYYWDTWDDVQSKARHTTGYTLYQDGDLWAINFDKMTLRERQNFGFDIQDELNGMSAC